MTKKQNTPGQQPDKDQLYRCIDCPDQRFVKEDMFVHSSGSVTNFCKNSMSLRRRQGRAKAKRLRKGERAEPKKLHGKGEVAAIGSRMMLVLSFMQTKKSGHIFPVREILKACGGKRYSDATRHAIYNLVSRKMVTCVKRGQYKLRVAEKKVKSQDTDINKALSKANEDVDVFRQFANGLIDRFQSAGKKLTKVAVEVLDVGIKIRYEALETGEVTI